MVYWAYTFFSDTSYKFLWVRNYKISKIVLNVPLTHTPPYTVQFSEVKDLLSALRQLRIDLHPAPAGTPQLSTGTMSSAASSQVCDVT